MPLSSGPIQPNTAPSVDCSTSTKRWASWFRKWWDRRSASTFFLRAPAWLSATTNSAGQRASAASDGLIRLVPGLGTRAVDRVVDDYPGPVAPGQPTLRANVTVDEILQYSLATWIVINLETNSFETVDVQEILRTCGALPADTPTSFAGGSRPRRATGRTACPTWRRLTLSLPLKD